jgi:hypothetical protein
VKIVGGNCDRVMKIDFSIAIFIDFKALFPLRLCAMGTWGRARDAA